MSVHQRQHPPGRAGWTGIPCLLALLSLFVGAAWAAPPGLRTITTAYDGGPALAHASCTRPAVSGDGRYVAFISDATNWGAAPGSGAQVYVRDRNADTVELASRATSGEPSNGPCTALAMTPDARYVAFVSMGSNLGVDGRVTLHVYVRDRAARKTVQADVTSNGIQGAADIRTPLAISDDGRFVAFASPSASLVNTDSAGEQVYVRDLQTGAVERVSVNSAGQPGTGNSGVVNSGFAGLAMSADGSKIVFRSEAADLVPFDTNNYIDVFIRNRLQGTTERVSVQEGGAQLYSGSESPAISANGRFVTFSSWNYPVPAGAPRPAGDLFVRDLLTGTVEPVIIRPPSVASGGVSTGEHFPSISADGRYIAYAGDTAYILDDPFGRRDIFLRDRFDGTTTRVSQRDDGLRGDGDSTHPAISADGSRIAYETDSKNLVPGTTQGILDVMVWTRTVGTERGGAGPGQTVGTRPATSLLPAMSAGGDFVAFQSDAFNLVPGDTNDRQDVFLWTRATNTIERVELSTTGGEGTGRVSDFQWRGRSSITPDGRYVVFTTDAEDLVPATPRLRGTTWVYVRDRVAGTTELVSVKANGTPFIDNSWCGTQAISADGRYVTFVGTDPRIVNGEQHSTDIFMRDRVAHTTTLVSVRPDGGIATGMTDYLSAPSITADGRQVAFSYGAPDLTPEIPGTPYLPAVYVRDLAAGKTERVDIATAGYPDTVGSSMPFISADGRYVAFESWSSALIFDDSNGRGDVLVRDRVAGTLERVSRDPNNQQFAGESIPTAISPDGRFILFANQAAALVDGPYVQMLGVYLRDRSVNRTELISDMGDGRLHDTSSFYPAGGISADGRRVAFSGNPDYPIWHPDSFDILLRERVSAPLPPVNVKAVANSPHEVRLTWDSVSHSETSFQVERRSPSGTFAPLATVDASTLAFTDTTVEPNTGYAYRVRGVNGAGPSDYSMLALVGVPPNPPGAPTLTGAEALSPTAVRVTWQGNGPVPVAYEVERRTGSGDFAQIAVYSGTVTQFDDTGLSPKTSYAYRVRVHGVDGYSAYSNELTVTSPPLPPGAPNLNSVTPKSPESARLVWLAPGPEVTEYRIERRSGAAEYAETARVSGSTLQYGDTSLTPGTTYFYRVRAVNDGGPSPYSNEVSVSVPNGLPASPSSLAVRPLTDTQVDLEWTAGDPEAETRVERQTGTGAFMEIATVPAGMHDYEDTQVTGGTTYVYRLRAHNQYGFSAYSAAIPVTTPAPASGIAVIPAKLSFPMTKVRQTSRAVLTVRNSDRKHSLRITVFAPALPFVFPGQLGPRLIPPGATVKMELHFTPASKGTSVGKLILKTSQPGRETVTVALSGKGRL